MSCYTKLNTDAFIKLQWFILLKCVMQLCSLSFEIQFLCHLNLLHSLFHIPYQLAN